MNWIVFNKMLLNLDHVISIDHVGNRSLDVFVAGSPNLQTKRVEFGTEEERDAAFGRIKAFVTGEENEG